MICDIFEGPWLKFNKIQVFLLEQLDIILHMIKISLMIKSLKHQKMQMLMILFKNKKINFFKKLEKEDNF
jgi:hypothetical protein